MAIIDTEKLFEKLEQLGEENVRLKLAQGVFAPKRKIDLVKYWLEQKEKAKMTIPESEKPSARPKKKLKMELNNDFHSLVSKLVSQKLNQLSREQSQRRDEILKGSVRKGFNILPGYVHRQIDDLQVNSIRRRGDIVWSALEQTLEAFDPSFYSELATQLHSLAESFFPLTLCEPHKCGLQRSSSEEANQQLRSQLEIERDSSLNTVKTKIDLYVAKKRSKSIGEDLSPLESEFQKKWDNGNTLTISILFLAADPSDAVHLRIGKEFREIQEQLQLSKYRDRFRLKLPQLSVRPADISRALLATEPRIVHFSGHGASTGALCFENQQGQTHPVKPDALAELYKQFANQVDCVLLNACYSETQARAIAEHIKYVIGMNKAIGDEAAIAFAIGFYQALGAGRTIEDAFKLGCVQIRLQGILEHLTPVLIKEGQIQQ